LLNVVKQPPVTFHSRVVAVLMCTNTEGFSVETNLWVHLSAFFNALIHM